MALAKHDADSKICDVAGCDKESERSLSPKQVVKSSLSLKDGEHRSVHLCKEHYKMYKKETKTSRDLDSVY